MKCNGCSQIFTEPKKRNVGNQEVECCPHCDSLSFESEELKPKTYHKKLVRDKVLNNLRLQGIKYEAIKIEDIKKMHILLLETLSEDVECLKKGFSADGLADIIETVVALGGINKLAFEDIMQYRRKKLEKLGSYQHGCYLMWTEEKSPQ